MHRRGYTLIEMVVAITLGAAIVGASVGALLVLLRTEQAGRNRAAQSGITARLAEQFRNDVGAATHHVADAQKGEWQFVLPDDRVVTYRTLPGRVEWDERAAGKVVREESYVLPDGCSTMIEVSSRAEPATASLIVKDTGTPHRTIRERRVTAVLGKDHRFTKSPDGGQ